MRKRFAVLMLIATLVAPVRAMDVIGDDDITRTAVASGNWFNASTWNGAIPGVGDTVRIPPGLTVTYAGVSAAALRGVRIDGTLRFATDTTSEMVVDTLEVTMPGRLQIGTLANPVRTSAAVRIRFSSASDIDIGWDPTLISRGLIAHGDVQIHGQRKTVHTKVAIDPRAGDSTLTLATAPENWRVGDTLVLTGTRYSGWKWDNSILAVRYHDTQDEVLTIAAINGATITLAQPLQYNHLTPRADLKASVANMTRNVSFATVNGANVPMHRRGHVMLMHHTRFDVRYAEFEQLGRTRKDVASFDIDQVATVTPSSNLRGRYPLHFHLSGIDTPSSPAIAIGNAVMRSPGWGYVHHGSNAVFHNNASFDTHGAGFVAETGDEIGAWTNNIAIKARGNDAFNPKNGNDVASYDMARTGDGFWFQGRMVRSVGNIAASVNHGFVYLHRGTRMRSFPNTAFPMPEALTRSAPVWPDDPPILNFHDNEAFASTVGLYVVKANPNQEHDIHTHLSRFLAWEVQAGAALEYTSHYLLEDFDIVGKSPEAFSEAMFGIEFGTNTSDMVINRAHVARMATGVILSKIFTVPQPLETNQYALIDVTFANVAQPYQYFDAAHDRILTAADLVEDRFEVVLNGGLPLAYLSPATSAGSGLAFSGTKTDSIGAGPLPAGTDWLGIEAFDMIDVCAEDGYLRTAEGVPYAIVGEYFTNRATGTIHKRGLKIRLGPQVDALLGNPFHAWRDAFERGPINLQSVAPVANDDVVSTARETDIVIAVLANDSDADGDALVVDGIVEPLHGLLFKSAGNTLTYRPDFDFVGTDTFRYWASDRQGNFTPATVTVSVSADAIFDHGFE